MDALFFKNEQSSSSYTTGLLKQFAKINVFSEKAFSFIEHGLLKTKVCISRAPVSLKIKNKTEKKRSGLLSLPSKLFRLFILVIYMIVS